MLRSLWMLASQKYQLFMKAFLLYSLPLTDGPSFANLYKLKLSHSLISWYSEKYEKRCARIQILTIERYCTKIVTKHVRDPLLCLIGEFNRFFVWISPEQGITER